MIIRNAFRMVGEMLNELMMILDEVAIICRVLSVWFLNFEVVDKCCVMSLQC